MRTKFSARQNTQIIEIEFSESDSDFNSRLFINANEDEKCIHLQGQLFFEERNLKAIHLTSLASLTADTELTTTKNNKALIDSTIAFFLHRFNQENENSTEIVLNEQLRELNYSYNNPTDIKQHRNTSNITPDQFIANEDVSSMHHVQSSDISAAIALYKKHLKGGCEQLLALNSQILKAERKEIKIQILYRLGWISALSSLVIVISYLTIGVNMFTAIGLLAAYLGGLMLHRKYSPPCVDLEKEKQPLYELNNKLRSEILAVETQCNGNLYRLLEATGLVQDARKKGLSIAKGQINGHQLDGNGLYQYLDATNLLMEHPDRLESLSDGSF